MDDKFHIQGIIVIFHEVGTKWDFLDQTTSFNFGWTWFTCNHTNIRTNTTIRFRHDNLTIKYLTYLTTFRCELFQTFQNNTKKKNVIVINNYSELNKATLARWVTRQWKKHLPCKTFKVILGLQGFGLLIQWPWTIGSNLMKCIY